MLVDYWRGSFLITPFLISPSGHAKAHLVVWIYLVVYFLSSHNEYLPL